MAHPARVRSSATRRTPANDRRRSLSRQPPGSGAHVAGQDGPRPALLAGEGPLRRARRLTAQLGVALEERRLGQHEPGLGQVDRHLGRFQLGDRLGRGFPSLVVEPDGQQCFAAILEQDGAGHVERSPQLIGPVVTGEGGGDVAGPGLDVPEVVGDGADQPLLAETLAQCQRPEEVIAGCGQLEPVGVQDAPVAQQASLPEPIILLAEHDQRPAVAVQRFVLASQPGEDDRQLRLQPGGIGALQGRRGQPGLAQRGRGVAAVGEGEGQAHPRLRLDAAPARPAWRSKRPAAGGLRRRRAG